VSVRGSEFIVEYSENKTDLTVIEGEVLFKNLISEEEIIVLPFEFCSIIEKEISPKVKKTDEELKAMLADFLPPKVKIKEKIVEERYLLREKLHEFVDSVKTDDFVARELLEEIKEADFAAGRTLLDVHGNTVQVEQLVLRPDPYTLQFLNLTKRKSYTYRGKGNFGEVVQTSPRLDVADVRLKFSHPLPWSLLELPSWAKKYARELYVKRFDFIMMSRTNKGEDSLGWKTYEEAQNRDESPEINFMIKSGDEEWKWNDKYFENKILKGGNATGGKNELWLTYETPIPMMRENESKVFWLQGEFYFINNKGKILTPKFFLESEYKDPFSILREIAIEKVFFIKYAKLENTSTHVTGKTIETYICDKERGDFFKNNKNIDLVATPDIVLSIIEKVLIQEDTRKLVEKEIGF
jgi:hypothetical protein